MGPLRKHPTTNFENRNCEVRKDQIFFTFAFKIGQGIIVFLEENKFLEGKRNKKPISSAVLKCQMQILS